MANDQHADDEPVIFGYAASCNISFKGKRESGYTWGEWREMNDKERDDAYMEFIFNSLGVEVFVK